MLQDIQPYKYQNEFLIKTPSKEDYILIFDDNHICLCNQNKSFPTFDDIQKSCDQNDLNADNFVYIFSIDQHNFFLGMNLNIDSIKNIYKENTQIFRIMEPKWMSFAGVTGSQLFRWYHEHGYCGKCGNPLEKSITERALTCKCCKLTIYPKISPAVIVGITNGDKLLMSTYANRTYKRYALIAGFTEVGETLEDTVKREVMEEVGLNVKNIRYYKNQPWSFSDSLLIGFFAELDGSDVIKIDENELSEARWFHRDEIPESDSDISLTSEMIEAFRSKNL